MSDIYTAGSNSNTSESASGGGTTTFPKPKSKNREALEKSIIMLKEEHGPDKQPFSAFRFFPTNTNFFNKDPNEKVVLLLRKHPITNVPWIIASFVLVMAPSFLTILPVFDSFPVGYRMLFVIAWYLLTFAYILEKFLSWFFNVNIITDERVFDVDFKNLIYREITDAEIDQIQDVTVSIGSAVRTVFNYGNVSIQTASEIPRIQFEAVPHPDKVARILRELRIEEEVEELEGRIR